MSDGSGREARAAGAGSGGWRWRGAGRRAATKPRGPRRRCGAVAAASLALLVLRAMRVGAGGTPREPAAQPAAVLWEALEEGLVTQRQAIPSWAAVADSAAARLVAGGRMWVGGSFPDFDGEACNRAGGPMAIAPLREMGRTPGTAPGPLDVVLLGLHQPRPEDRLVAAKLTGRGPLAVGFGSRVAHGEAAARLNAWLESGAPQVVAGAPAASILAVASLWAFNGEVIAACVRRGRMPTVWQSILMAGSEARNARYRPHRFHGDVLPPPVAAGVIAAAYLDSLAGYLGRFRQKEWAGLEEAGDLMRAARCRGGRAFACPLGGHLRPNLMDLAGPAPEGASRAPAAVAAAAAGTVADLADVSRYATAADLADALRPGDGLYIQGYVEAPADLLGAAAAAGAATVVSLAGRGGQGPGRDAADVVLDAQWELGDAAVPLAGYDVPLLPPSGFMAAAMYWALVLESNGAQR